MDLIGLDWIHKLMDSIGLGQENGPMSNSDVSACVRACVHAFVCVCVCVTFRVGLTIG